MEIIAKIHTDFPEKFGIPRQSGLAESRGVIVFEPKFRNPDALRGIDGYSHLWLIWQFSKNPPQKWSPTVRPPRLGGNKRVGVFATRSPFRPNSLGLSSVRLLGVKHTDTCADVLIVSGADMADGTPILDIKPYLAYTDSHPDAVCAFADGALCHRLEVKIEDSLLEKVPPEKRNFLIDALAYDNCRSSSSCRDKRRADRKGNNDLSSFSHKISSFLRQYRTELVLKMRCQIFRQIV